MMKQWKLGWILVGMFLLSGYTEKVDYVNGWYHLIGKEGRVGEMIVTVKDFAELRLDSTLRQNGSTSYYIVGRVCKEKVKTWAEATEKAIGSSIGFMFNNNLITKPTVNMRIDSGNFMIALPPDRQTEMKTIFKELSKEMNTASAGKS